MFLFNGNEAHRRSLSKAVSWRVLGSIDTFILSLIFTSSVKAAGSIAATEVITKITLYYFHERLWAFSGWGHRKPESQKRVLTESARMDAERTALVPTHSGLLAISDPVA